MRSTDQQVQLHQDFSDEEISRRRDEVVRRMANTAPQHKGTGDRLEGMKKNAGGDHATRKAHERRRGSTET